MPARSFASPAILFASPARAVAAAALSLSVANSCSENIRATNSTPTPSATSVTNSRSRSCSFASGNFLPPILRRTAIGRTARSVHAINLQKTPAFFPSGSTWRVSLLSKIHSSPKQPAATINAAPNSTQPKQPNSDRIRMNLLMIVMGVCGILISITALLGMVAALLDYKHQSEK